MYIEQIVSVFLLYLFVFKIKLDRFSRVVALTCNPSGREAGGS